MDVRSKGKPEMEEKKCHHHPSLPPNYVTIAQLQERWLKQHQQNQQPPQQQEQQQRNQKYQNDNQGQQQGAQNRGEGAYVVRTRGAAFRSSSGKQQHRNMQSIYIPKIRTDSGVKNATDEKHRESELEAGNGDENADLKSKGDESKKKHWNKAKRKPRVDERGTSEGKAEEAKSQVKNEKEEKNSEATDATIESEVKKEEEKFEDVETAIEEGESNEKKKVDSKLEEVKEKIRDLSVNSVNGKQNEGLRRVRDDFRYTQFQSSYSGRGFYGYRNGHRDRNFGGGFSSQRNEVKSLKAEKMVWVRKDNHVMGN